MMPQEQDLEKRVTTRLLDVLIKAGLIAAMVVLCYRVFAPFITLMLWAIILAVTLHPLQQKIARKLGGKQGLASTLLILGLMLVLVTPGAFLLNSFGDSVRHTVEGVQNNTLQIRPPRESVQKWPVIGPKVYATWLKAHEDLPALVKSLQPKIGELARQALAVVSGLGLGFLLFLGAMAISGIIMAYGESGARACRAIAERLAGPALGERVATLSTATVRTVAQGVLGVALIQAILIGISLLVAGVPFAGVLSAIALVLAIAQIPTLIITVPAIIWLWSGPHHGVVANVVFTILLLVAGLIDNLLKPFFLGRGVDAPMPVILLGALGGMASDGILGMFVGAVLLALGYQIFMGWVRATTPTPAPATPAA